MESKPQQVQTPTKHKLRATALWVKKPYNERNIWERLASIDVASAKCYEVQSQNQNPPPTHNVWIERVVLAISIAPPLVIQALWYHFVPIGSSFHVWHPAAAFIFYYLTFVVFTFIVIKYINYFMDLYGTFDGHKRPRDYVADNRVTRVVIGIIIQTLTRVAGAFILGGYNRSVPPSLGGTISWMFPVKIGIWLIALDFFFYSFHRAVHTVSFLWRIHSMHHSVKHPTATQVRVVSDIENLLEICLIPLAASLIMPLSVHEHWIAQCVLLSVELVGHSGARAYWVHPILYEVLQPFKMEICIEDHDLHHRFGKSGLNYGKQTRIFDRLFGTICERVECMQK